MATETASNRAAAAAAPRVFAFAKALGLTVEHMVTLLETYDLHLLSGPAMREEVTRSVGVVWSCSHCGPHPDSTATWCAAGCGRDYNKMSPCKPPQ